MYTDNKNFVSEYGFADMFNAKIYKQADGKYTIEVQGQIGDAVAEDRTSEESATSFLEGMIAGHYEDHSFIKILMRENSYPECFRVLDTEEDKTSEGNE